MATRAAVGWLAAAAAAAAAYGVLTRRVRRGATQPRDADARRAILSHSSSRARRLADATGHIGKWYTLVPAALAGAGALVVARRGAAGATLASAALVAAAASPVLERVHAGRRPPPGKTREDPDAHRSFPSNHAFETTAVALVAAWVLAREGLAPPAAVAAPAALAALISGVGRLVLDRHWVSDSAAGYCAGVALGGACLAGYEHARP